MDQRSETTTSDGARRGGVKQLAGAIRSRAARQKDAYAHGEERPLAGYALLLGTYTTGSALLAYVVRRRRTLPERPSAADLALVAVATHSLTRLVSKDSVLAVVRAPFTTFQRPSGPGEVQEDVRRTGVAHAVGELLTCPFCLAPWTATALTFGMLLAPKATRQVASVFTAVAVSDLLQFAYAAAEQAAE